MRLRPLGFVLALAACGGKPSAPDAAPTAPDTASAAVDTAPAKPPSRLSEAQAFFDKELTPGGFTNALALADALAAEDTPEAELAAARIRLATVARDMAGVVGKPNAELELGAAAKTQVELVLAAGTDPGLPGDDGKRITSAARAIRRMLGDPAATLPDLAALRALETDAHPEAAAYRLALVATYGRMREVGGDTIGLVVAPTHALGPFLCSACGDGMTADVATKPASDGTGLQCSKPEDAGYCGALLAVQGKEPLAKEPENALVVAALELAARLEQGASDVDGPALGPTMKTLARALEPVVLPVPVVLGVEPWLGNGGPTGLAESSPALVVAELGPEVVKIGVRAVVAPGGALASDTTGVALDEAPPLAFADLAKIEPDKDTGAIAGVTDRLKVVREALAKAPTEGPGMLPGDQGVVLLAIDPKAPVAGVEAVGDGLLAGTPAGLRVLRPGPLGEVLPLHLRTLPAELETALVPSWDKTMVAVVKGDVIEVWGPEGAKDGATPIGPEAADGLPQGAKQGWRKDVLARLAVPIAPPADPAAARVTSEVLKGVADAVKVFADQAKAGRVVHIVAGDGATVMDVLLVARHLQEIGLEPATELGRVGEIWPGAKCRGEAGCAGAVAVAFSKRAPPSSRGLTDKPGGKKETKPAEPKPEPGPAPSAEFCNQGDIKSQMAKKAGSFRFCYERELQLQKDLQGRVVMSFVIGLNGAVKSVRVASSDLANAKVGECIKKEIGKITFKAPDGGECVVQWPFKFTSN